MDETYEVILNGTHRMRLSPGDTIKFDRLGDTFTGPNWEHTVTKLGTFKFERIVNGAAEFTLIFKD